MKMAHITTDDVKHIRDTLKKELPQYKFSVVRDHYSSVSIAFMKGTAFKDYEYRDRYTHETKIGTLNEGHHQINHYHLEDFYGEENAKILNKVSEIAHTAPAKNGGTAWYNKSDAMIDYFDTAYYVHISIGKWNKPYQIAA
tara:strand:+ start:1544 stop:1966 length:423 start_codon:yes stop_codon:yes gene_type:complete